MCSSCLGEGTQIFTNESDTENTVQSLLVDHINLSAQNSARGAMNALAQRLSALGRKLGNIGSGQSRLSVMSQSNLAARENYTASASRITDIDVASDTAQLVRQQILQQTGVSVLAQANHAPELALRFLTG